MLKTEVKFTVESNKTLGPNSFSLCVFLIAMCQ
uniref:Uncharacterized protein n=1 Tax=Anguilla anguilla TaxID=7936 RepID=A0A0E9VUV9_ANGAN